MGSLDSSANWSKVILHCASKPHKLKLFVPYPEQLRISNCMCSFLKAYLFSKFVRIFLCFIVALMVDMVSYFLRQNVFLKVHIYNTKVSELELISK